MCPALPDSQYYGGSASSQTDRWTTHPAPDRADGTACGQARNLPMFTCCSLAEGGTRLSACGPVDAYSVVIHHRPRPAPLHPRWAGHPLV